MKLPRLFFSFPLQAIRLKTFAGAALVLFAACMAVQANTAGYIKISGAIGPITSTYVQRAIQYASKQHYSCLIIQLDTPGGLLNATKEIVEAFFSSPVPTVVYVAPEGASAASAGCFITLAAEVAAMAPGTSIGAAHPVTMGGSESKENGEIMKQKLENYASSFIESIAAHRNRNVQWAVASVRQSAAITAEKALNLKVIDYIAKTPQELLLQMDGRKVSHAAPLHTAGAELREIPMLVREQVFQRLWSPEVMYLLILMAIYGIIGELSSPGAILPAVVGGISLILALFMASILPVNATGVALIILAVCLFITDIFAPTHGILTIGGIIAFFVGSIMLFDTAISAFRLSLALIIPATIISALFFIFVFGAGWRAQMLPVRAGKESLIGKTASAVTPITGESGKVFVDGSYWNACSEGPIEKGAQVEITKVKGLTLVVRQKA